MRRAQSRRKVFRPFGPFGPTIAALAVCVSCVVPPALGLSQPAEPQSTPPVTPETPSEGGLSVVDRAVQAFRADPVAGEAELTRLLRNPETAEATLTSVSDLERLPVSVWRAVSTCTTAEYPVTTRLLAVRLLPRFGSRDAATRLIALLDDTSEAITQTARQSLRELTGRGEGWKDEQWKSWGAEAAAWSDRAWTSMMVTRLVAKSRSMADLQRALGDEVVALYRRLHVELDAAGRTTLLAELIRDDRAALRDLGFELAGRDLSARTQLGPEVATAATARLNHPDAATRARAATLVTRLVPPDAMITLTRALGSETVASAAEPMLLGIARWPNDAAVIPTARWLERPDAPFGAVSTALWSLAQADLLTDPALRERVLAALRSRDTARGGEPALKLLVRLGDASDLARVAALLESPEDPLRNAAAGALAETPAGAARLIESAGSEPRLFAPAARAINTHMPTPDGLRKLAGLQAIDPAMRDAAILELALKLRPGELAKAVEQAGLPDTLREQALARLADPERERTPEVLDGLLLLADTRINLRRPTEALLVLRSIDPAGLGAARSGPYTRLMLVATVASGDLDAALGVAGLTLDDWLAAWRRLPESSELRRPVAEAINTRFASALSTEQRAELGITPPPAGTPATIPGENSELATQPDDTDAG